VKDSLGVVPFGGLPGTARVVSVTIAPRTDLGAGVTFNAELARVFPALRSISLTTEQVFDATAAAAAQPGQNAQYIATPQPRLLPALVENALRGAQGADVVIVSSYFGASSSTSRLAAPEGMADLLNGLQKAGTRVVLATFSNPYIAQDLPPSRAISSHGVDRRSCSAPPRGRCSVWRRSVGSYRSPSRQSRRTARGCDARRAPQALVGPPVP
jgi:hypothetical protein